MAGGLAFAAADAFGAVHGLCGINAHGAGGCTGAAGGAGIGLHGDLMDGKAAAQCIKCAKRAKIPAEAPRDPDRRQKQRGKHGELPGKEHSGQGAEPRIGKQMGDAINSLFEELKREKTS